VALDLDGLGDRERPLRGFETASDRATPWLGLNSSGARSPQRRRAEAPQSGGPPALGGRPGPARAAAAKRSDPLCLTPCSNFAGAPLGWRCGFRVERRYTQAPLGSCCALRTACAGPRLMACSPWEGCGRGQPHHASTGFLGARRNRERDLTDCDGSGDNRTASLGWAIVPDSPQATPS
jgi:hypothetical protein